MDGSPETNRVTAADSSPPQSASPAVQESPFSNFLSNLTPINTLKTESYSQRLVGAFLPAPPVVFTSPRIDLERESSLLERNDVVEVGSNVDFYKECSTTIVNNSSFEEVRLSSVSGSIDDYLADPVKVDCTSSADIQSGNSASKESNAEAHEVIGSSSKSKDLTTSNQPEENLPLPSLEQIETTVIERTYKISADFVTRAQGHGQNITKEVNQHHRGIRRHLQFETAVAHKSSSFGSHESPCSLTHDTVNIRSASKQTNLMTLASSHSDSKAFSSPQGLTCDTSQLSSCLYESVRSIGGNSSTFPPICSGINLHLNSLTRSTSNIISSRKSTGCMNTPDQMLEHDNTENESSSPQGLTCGTSQLSSCLYESVRSIGGNSSTFPPICSGINLHLNSLTRSTSNIISSRKSTGCMNTPDQMLEHDNTENQSSSTFISDVPLQNYTYMGDDQQGTQTAVHNTFSFYSANGLPYLPRGSTDQILVDQESVLCDEMNASQDAKRIEELNQQSQKKKRKRGAEISEGCKRCNCKKSKCLKLYCECFAAGVFCLDSCSCENCYNKPEFEDTVFDARQQIESRNPLAFAPRVIKHDNNSSPITKDADWTTPSSARHKRGCNCKKSKCLKKYCECYQANVGCSGSCRCDGCENPCGKIDQDYIRAEKWESHPVEKLDKVGNECIKASNMDLYSPSWEGLSVISNLTPLSKPCPSNVVSSASSSVKYCTRKSQAQLQPSRLQPSATGHLKRGRSPVIFTPQVFESKGPYQLSSDGASFERMDGDIPELLKEPSIPPKIVNGSPNQKRVSPPQSQAEKLRSRSPKGLRSGRKFILQAVPSFPPLSPYSNSEVVNDTRNNHESTQIK